MSESSFSDPLPSIVQVTAPNEDGGMEFVVDERLCVGPEDRPFLFGGAALGEATRALEVATGREVGWVTAQFRSSATIGDEVHLMVDPMRSGRRATQASIVATVAGREIFTALGSLTEPEDGPARTWHAGPMVVAPDGLERTLHWRGARGIHSCIEVRVVRGRYGSAGRMPRSRMAG